MDASAARRRALQSRDALDEGTRARLSRAIWERLSALAAFRQAKLALFYVSRGSEVDTGAMRQGARALGMRVAAPRSDPSVRGMRFHRLGDPETLVPGPYGILEPPAEAPPAGPPFRDAVVLVPGSAFDRRGRRLGLGGGYYDRWLAGEGRGLTSVGLAFHGQLLPEVPAGPLDVPVHWLVTDRETLECVKI